jgi:hypothetical protein
MIGGLSERILQPPKPRFRAVSVIGSRTLNVYDSVSPFIEKDDSRFRMALPPARLTFCGALPK